MDNDEIKKANKLLSSWDGEDEIGRGDQWHLYG